MNNELLIWGMAVSKKSVATSFDHGGFQGNLFLFEN